MKSFVKILKVSGCLLAAVACAVAIVPVDSAYATTQVKQGLRNVVEVIFNGEGDAAAAAENVREFVGDVKAFIDEAGKLVLATDKVTDAKSETDALRSMIQSLNGFANALGDGSKDKVLKALGLDGVTSDDTYVHFGSGTGSSGKSGLIKGWENSVSDLGFGYSKRYSYFTDPNIRNDLESNLQKICKDKKLTDDDAEALGNALEKKIWTRNNNIVPAQYIADAIKQTSHYSGSGEQSSGSHSSYGSPGVPGANVLDLKSIFKTITDANGNAGYKTKFDEGKKLAYEYLEALGKGASADNKVATLRNILLCHFVLLIKEKAGDFFAGIAARLASALPSLRNVSAQIGTSGSEFSILPGEPFVTIVNAGADTNNAFKKVIGIDDKEAK